MKIWESWSRKLRELDQLLFRSQDYKSMDFPSALIRLFLSRNSAGNSEGALLGRRRLYRYRQSGKLSLLPQLDMNLWKTAKFNGARKKFVSERHGLPAGVKGQSRLYGKEKKYRQKNC